MNSLIISLCFLLPFSSLGQLQPSSSPDHDRVSISSLPCIFIVNFSVIYLIMVMILDLFFQQGLSFEEKTRLGSTPPSCHNKCNGCHPCMAVQVPTFPSRHDRFQPGLSKAISTTDDDSMQFFDPSSDQYSNYKPLGWKCRCGDHFYKP